MTDDPNDPGKPWVEGDTLRISLPDEMPLAALQELVSTGEIMTVTTFRDHMRPTDPDSGAVVHWIAPTEYREAFEEMTSGAGAEGARWAAGACAGDGSDRPDERRGVRAMRDEAAFTQKPTGLPHDYPGFVHARLGMDGTTMEITLRGDQPSVVLGDGDSIQPGKQATLIVPLDDFDQWIADVARVRSGA